MHQKQQVNLVSEILYVIGIFQNTFIKKIFYVVTCDIYLSLSYFNLLST